MNPKTKYGYVMTVFAPFLNPNFHLPLFYRLLLPWTAWIASGFKYLLGWAEQQEACEVFFPLTLSQFKIHSVQNHLSKEIILKSKCSISLICLKFLGRNTKISKAFFGNSSTSISWPRSCKSFLFNVNVHILPILKSNSWLLGFWMIAMLLVSWKLSHKLC